MYSVIEGMIPSQEQEDALERGTKLAIHLEHRVGGQEHQTAAHVSSSKVAKIQSFQNITPIHITQKAFVLLLARVAGDI